MENMEQATEITKKLEEIAREHNREYAQVHREYLTVASYLLKHPDYQKQENMRRIPFVSLRITEENIQAQKNRSTQEKNNYQKNQ